MHKIIKLIKAFINKETILYLLFGLLTTVVSFASLKIFDVILGKDLYLVSNTASWLFSVSFAYITNKIFVFESKSWSVSVLKKEIPSFFSARIFSYFVEQGSLWLLMEALGFKERVFDFIIVKFSGLMTAKMIIGVLVVAINYVLSKLLIFRKKEKTSNNKENPEN